MVTIDFVWIMVIQQIILQKTVIVSIMMAMMMMMTTTMVTKMMMLMMRKTFSSGFGDGDCGSEDYSYDGNDDDIDKDLSAGGSKKLHFEVVLSAVL